MPLYEYDDAEHTYQIDGRAAPGLSQILSLSGFLDGMMAPEDALERGKRVHKAIELHLQRDLDEASIPAEDRGYFDSFLRFEDLGRAEFAHAEYLTGNAELWYCTQIDGVGLFDGEPMVANFKTGDAYPHYSIQLAGEALCMGEPLPKRVGIYLRADGEFDPASQIVVHDDARDFQIFKAAAAVADWKIRHGLGWRVRRSRPVKREMQAVASELFDQAAMGPLSTSGIFGL